MARNTLAHACLLAMLVVAGAMPTAAELNEPTPGLPDASAIDTVTGAGPSCAKTDDDAGMGGTQVSCKYSCAADNLLAIGGSAADPDATASGSTACGGTFANCETLRNKCKGVSEGMTTQAQARATCSGMSDEFWSSPMTIACASRGADPQAVVCKLIEDLCNEDGVHPPEGLDGVDPPEGLEGLDRLPTLGTEDLQALYALCDKVVSSAQGLAGFVLAIVEAKEYTSLNYSPEDGCTVEVGSL